MLNNPKYKYVFFDLDGTLTDPFEGLSKAIIYALSKMGIDERNIDRLKSFIGPPLIVSFTSAYGFSREEALMAVEYYREYYEKQGIYENVVYEKIPWLLEKLGNCGVKLFVATAKPDKFANEVLSYFKIKDCFFDIAAVPYDDTEKPKYKLILEMLKKYNITDMENAIMIGDRKFDIEAAKLAGIASMGVTYGYGSNDELKTAEADLIANDAKEIFSLICEGK